ncbi:hypothetical protein HMPREF9151_00467 [Hoylesella saccharolytica F0055]|uniref:Uncharacterized protein n=1 Tax=Hoylesella saccharolytica F0055 TaxID=1127699 RepID=L1NJ87_9BACT|nr:hypothetical protein HMPREF9151_00467 [Hoylesella saccharolytica F0055]
MFHFFILIIGFILFIELFRELRAFLFLLCSRRNRFCLFRDSIYGDGLI